LNGLGERFISSHHISASLLCAQWVSVMNQNEMKHVAKILLPPLKTYFEYPWIASEWPDELENKSPKM
jgi:hypothetical protein